MDEPIWRPTGREKESSLLAQFVGRVCTKHHLDFGNFGDYAKLHQWSISHKDLFWREVWDFCGVIGEPGDRVLNDCDSMFGTRFFPDGRLNFAENLLRKRDDSDAIVFRGEDQIRARMSWSELHKSVSRLAQALRASGVGPGDRVAGIVANMPEAVVGMLATSSLGAVWSSCSPDFGQQAVIDRFGQIEPKVLIACDGYFYAGKPIDILPRLRDIVTRLPSLARVVVVPYLRAATGEDLPIEGIPNALSYDDLVSDHQAGEIEFAQVAFNDPLYILFSSGTTGVPKCIVHSVGGTLLQHLKEHQLQSDLKPGDRLFYFTTCTWMMWNWLVSALASQATLLLFDGSPFCPNDHVLFDFADEERVTHFGTSAKYIEELKKRGVCPKETHGLTSLRFMASTGSPLLPESFDFVYASIKSEIYLASIAGGTDIVSCFVSGSPLSPVYRGEIPCAGLGMAVEIWNDQGELVVEEKGELVCTKAFPCMPVEFWGDTDGERYRNAYFAQFPGAWAHGDFAERTRNGGYIIHGRSDATLNPGGVRIGTAEIYRQVDMIDDVLDSVVIGQAWEGDVRIVLFVVLQDDKLLTPELVKELQTRIRQGASPRHVPRKVVQVADVPRTKSGKITELAVRDIVEGREVKNRGALANPEALEQFRNLPELSE